MRENSRSLSVTIVKPSDIAWALPWTLTRHHDVIMSLIESGLP
jgi:hypothetical protein